LILLETFFVSSLGFVSSRGNCLEAIVSKLILCNQSIVCLFSGKINDYLVINPINNDIRNKYNYINIFRSTKHNFKYKILFLIVDSSLNLNSL